MLKRLLASLLIASTLGAGCVLTPKQEGMEFNTGTAESGSSWQVFSTFDGYVTRYDPEKVPDGAAPNGQNTTANHGDRISVRDQGYDLFPSSGTLSTTTTKIGTLHTFRRRDGSSILIRSSSSTLEWYEPANLTWETLNTGYTSDDFGFADNNINTDQTSYTYFGNAKEAFSRWNGGHTLINGALAGGETTITVDSTDGFSTTGTLMYCGTSDTYTGKTATTFTGASAHACANNSGIAQGVETFVSQTVYPRGNIYLLADNRLFISGTTSTQNQVFFSQYGSSTVFNLTGLVTTSTAASAGLFNLPEGGGPVTAMVMDEGSIYMFKRTIVYKATLTDAIYSIQPLKSFDQKSQTIGAVNQRSTFTSSNGVFFITPDNQIMRLERVEYIDYPQNRAVSEMIKPVTDQAIFSSSTGIVFRDKAYFSAKRSDQSTVNDTVFVLNLDTNQWDTPIVGWSASDFAIYQDPTSDHEELYYGDTFTQNVYVVTDTPTDYIYDVKASWRTKQYTFGLPAGQKYIENVFVEGYISPNTSLKISLLLDEDGFTQRYTTDFLGSEEAYLFNTSPYNVFGFTPFGILRFGTNLDLTEKKKFRVYLGRNFRQVPFYNASLEFASDGTGQTWEITNYGFLVRPAPVPEKRELFRAFQ